MPQKHYKIGSSYAPNSKVSSRIYNFDKNNVRKNMNNSNNRKYADAMLNYYNASFNSKIHVKNISVEPGIIKFYINETLDTNSINIQILSASILTNNILKHVKLENNFIQSTNYDNVTGLITIQLGIASGINSDYNNFNAKFVMDASNINGNIIYNYYFNY
jgi:hypothetical protein